MKKMFLFLFASLLGFLSFAQGGMRQTAEERVAVIHAKLDSAFKLEPSTLATLDTALTVLYKKQDEKLKEIFSGGERPDRETMLAERKKYSDARDEMLKMVLTAEQYIIWKEKIEPSMRPQRPMAPRD